MTFDSRGGDTMKRLIAVLISLMLILTLIPAGAAFADEEEYPVNDFGIACIVYGNGYDNSYFEPGENPSDELVFNWTRNYNRYQYYYGDFTYDEFMALADKTFLFHSDLKDYLTANSGAENSGFTYDGEKISFSHKMGGGVDHRLFVVQDDSVNGTGDILCQWMTMDPDNPGVYNVPLGYCVLTLENGAIRAFLPYDETPVEINISDAKITVKDQVYTGSKIKPAVKVELDEFLLDEGKDYEIVKYANNTDVGNAKVTIEGIGDFFGTKKATFKINPKPTKIKKLYALKKGFKVTYSKVSKQVTGYQVQFSATKTFKSGKNIKTVKSYKTTVKKVTGLKAKKTYYVRVRTYKKVGSKTFVSKWSKASKIKTK